LTVSAREMTHSGGQRGGGIPKILKAIVFVLHSIPVASKERTTRTKEATKFPNALLRGKKKKGFTAPKPGGI